VEIEPRRRPEKAVDPGDHPVFRPLDAARKKARRANFEELRMMSLPRGSRGAPWS
jgi:hypothetical protein